MNWNIPFRLPTLSLSFPCSSPLAAADAQIVTIVALVSENTHIRPATYLLSQS